MAGLLWRRLSSRLIGSDGLCREFQGRDAAALARHRRRGVKNALRGINEGLKQQMRGEGRRSDRRAQPNCSSFLFPLPSAAKTPGTRHNNGEELVATVRYTVENDDAC